MHKIKSTAKDIMFKLFEKLERLKWWQIYENYRRKYQIAPSFKFNGPGIEFYGDGEIIIGENSYIGRYSSIQAVKGNKVIIGKGCAISHYVMIYTRNMVADQDLSETNKKDNRGDVVIGDYCWIGAFVFIKEGVSIGENAVVGAHSVVNRDLPPHSISAGVPSKVVRFKSYLDKSSLLKLAFQYRNVLQDAYKEKLRKQFNIEL